MPSKHMSKRRLSAWYIPVALVIFFVVLWLVLQQVSSNYLSANIPRSSTMPKWSCNAICECKLMDWNNKVTILGKAETNMNICAYANIRFGQLPPEDQYYADDPCEHACDLQYSIGPRRGTVYSTDFQVTKCISNGVCLLTPSGLPIIKQTPTPSSTPIGAM
ncbi:MAG: hypothetical protein UW94_C0016G0019 [Parcubacteria group bacterium GW2011_GWA2_45_14]|nr:MAG: hypothetical protein UW94_C0016G0019 [Parcubacteria group bacterium GW2011_GWA2_45_14]